MTSRGPNLDSILNSVQRFGQAADFKFESKFGPMPTNASHLAIILKDYSRRQWNELSTKSMAKLLGQHSFTALVGWTGKHKHRVCGSRCWQQKAS